MIGVLVGLAVIAGIVAVLFVRDGDEGGKADVEGGLDFVEPIGLSARARADLRAALDALPTAVGATDAEKLHSVLGSPDVFQLWFDVGAGNEIRRNETWFYLDLEVSYEFINEELLFTIPMEPVPGLLLVPLRYDPLAFDSGTMLGDLRAMLDDGSVLVPEEVREEYGLDVTVWFGEQLFAAFDSAGELVYVETVALDLGDAE